MVFLTERGLGRWLWFREGERVWLSKDHRISLTDTEITAQQTKNVFVKKTLCAVWMNSTLAHTQCLCELAHFKRLLGNIPILVLFDCRRKAYGRG
jgi:hypothetical protein